MSYRRRKGFMFLLALMGVALAGGAVFVLSSSSRALLFDTNRALLDAQLRNMTASALSWAEQNRDRLPQEPKSTLIELNVGDQDVSEARLSVSVTGTERDTVRVVASGRRGRLVLNRTKAYSISADR